jgi:hypothetical protein
LTEIIHAGTFLPNALSMIVVNYLYASWVSSTSIFADASKHFWMPRLPLFHSIKEDNFQLSWQTRPHLISGSPRIIEWKRHLMINSKKRPDLMRVLITYEPAETKTNLG